mgnify:CR=1 FL=1
MGLNIRLKSRKMKEKEIVKVALGVFGRFGFFGASMEDIADKCGMGKASIYFYFKDKKELFKAALRMALDLEMKMLNRVKRMNKAFSDKIRILIKRYLSHFKRFRQGLRLLFLYPPQFDEVEFREIRRVLDEGFARRESIFEDILKEALYDIKNASFYMGKCDFNFCKCLSDYFEMSYENMANISEISKMAMRNETIPKDKIADIQKRIFETRRFGIKCSLKCPEEDFWFSAI